MNGAGASPTFSETELLVCQALVYYLAESLVQDSAVKFGHNWYDRDRLVIAWYLHIAFLKITFTFVRLHDSGIVNSSCKIESKRSVSASIKPR